MIQVEIAIADLSNPNHQSAIVSLLDAYARDIVDGGHGLAREVRERLIDGLQQHPGTLILLAFAADTPVGIAVCFSGFSTFAARPTINIHDVGVLEEYRGRGIGRALLDRVTEESCKRDCCKLTLEVSLSNKLAHDLYRRAGFGTNTHLSEETIVVFLEKNL